MTKPHTTSKLDRIGSDIAYMKLLLNVSVLATLENTVIKDDVLTLKDTKTYTYTCITLQHLNLLYDLSVINRCMGMAAFHIDRQFTIEHPFQTTRDDTLVFPQIKCAIVNYFIKTAIDIHKHFPNLETVMIHYAIIDHKDNNISCIMFQLISSLTCDTLYVMIEVERSVWSLTSHELMDLIKAVAINPNIKTLVIHNDQIIHFETKIASDIIFNRSLHLYLSNMTIKFNSTKNLTTHKFQL